jgi:hypothetical protein
MYKICGQKDEPQTAERSPFSPRATSPDAGNMRVTHNTENTNWSVQTRGRHKFSKLTKTNVINSKATEPRRIMYYVLEYYPLYLSITHLVLV